MIRFRVSHHLSDGEIIAFIDGELTGAQKARVMAHIGECPGCSGRGFDLEEGRRMVEGVLPSFPSALLERGRQSFERSSLRCPIDEPTLERLFGVNAARLSCLMVEELFGRGATPG